MEQRFFVTIHVSPWEIAAVCIGAATLVAFLIILFYSRQTAEEARRANIRADKEMNVRIRPWLGVVAAEYIVGTALDPITEDAFNISYTNVGMLPAADVVLTMVTTPENPAYFWPDIQIGTILPHEDSIIRLSSPLLRLYRDSTPIFKFNGSFEYRSGETHYVTKFAGTQSFQEGKPEIANTDVT